MTIFLGLFSMRFLGVLFRHVMKEALISMTYCLAC